MTRYKRILKIPPAKDRITVVDIDDTDKTIVKERVLVMLFKVELLQAPSSSMICAHNRHDRSITTE